MQNMGVQHKGGMYNMKRVIALLLTLVMLLGLVPTALAAEAAAPDGTVVKAEEVSGTPRLDAMAENDSAAETTQPTGHQPDDMVTILVELERVPVLEGFAAKKTASTSSAGAEIAAYLAGGRAEKQDAAIRRDQKKVFAEIQAAQPAALQAEGTCTACAPELMEQWTVLFNGMAVRAPYGMLDTIRNLKGVKSAHVQHVYSQPTSPATNAGVAGYSYDMVHLQEVWNKGYTGKGMLVAVVDSGLDMEYSSWWSDEEGANVTGLRRVHEAFRDDSFYSQLSDSDLRYTKESLLAFLNGRQLNANRLSPASNEAMYKTRKVPFAFDYAGDADPYTGEIISGDVNVRNSGSNHGTHVSGTVAGFVQSQEGEVLFSGVAPDAQLMMMKVFADGGNSGATESAILNALEDAMTLGADAVNLSLGSDNGFAYDDTAIHGVYARLEQAGVILMTAAGNSENSPAQGNERGGLNLAEDPDISMMSSPAVYPSNLAVASINSTINMQSVLSWNDAQGQSHTVPFSDPNEVAMKGKFPESQSFVVYDAGYGTYMDYYNAGFSNGYNGGKTGIALVKRGNADGSTLSFADKINNASSFSGTNYMGESYGVLAVLVYDSDPAATTLINMNTDNTSLTSAFISGVDGAAMIDALNAGQEVRITVHQQDQLSDWEEGGQMSSFTSWGSGSGLELKPEITAPGGNIWSTVMDSSYVEGAGKYDDYTGSYSLMSGTSMATPHMAGLAALVEQYVKSQHPQQDAAASADLTNHLLVSTAVPQQENGVYVSPRRQGAGLVNAAAAISTPAYIDVDGKLVGKLELGDDPGWSGSYDLDFRVENLGGDTLSYSMKAVLLRPDTAEQDGKTMVLASDVLIREVDLGSVSVPAGGTQVSRTVSLTASDIAAIRDLFPNGSYVEGFVILTAADGSAPQIGMPLLAFLGDWTSAPILDRANWFDEPQDGENVMNNDCTLGVNVVGSTIRSAGEVVNFLNLGQNIFDTDIAAESKQTVFHQENFAISPDGSGYFDAIDDLELYQLRDAKLFVTEVRNKNTNELYFRTFNTYVPRSVYQAGYGVVLPMSLYYFTDAWDGTDLNGDVLPNGTQCVYTITAYGEGDYGDTVDNEELGRPVTDFESFVDGKEPTFNGHKMDKTGDVLSFDVLVDTQAPKLENNAVTFYQKDGRTYMQGTVYDEDGSLASVAVHAQVSRTYTDSTGREITEYNIDLLNPLYSQSIYDADTHTFTFTADVTEYRGSYNWTGNVYLSCGDYAANDRTYAIKVDASQGLTLSQTSARLHPGQSFDLSVNNNTGSTAPITRTSSNPEVATVDEFGHVVAVAPGQAIITVSNGTYSALCVIAVEASSTEVKDFKLSMDHFSGLKPNGAITVRVVDLQPADVEIYQNQWLVYEDDEDWAGLVSVSQNSSDALEGLIDLNYQASADKIPSGTGHLDVTINGVTRTMTFDWEDVYQTSDQEDLQSDAYYNEQTYYVTAGETASLIARYRQTHSFSDVKLYTAQGYVSGGSDNPTTAATGLVLDGPDFVLSGSEPWRGRLVNTEGYALPESIHVVYRYDYGYEYELTENAMYNGYTYDRTTGDIVVSAPYGSSTTVVIRADGTEKAGNPAGALSGVTYDRPDSTYGPFNWTVTEGGGKLETAEDVNVNGTRKNVAYYTPSEPGVSYLTATTKDGQYHVNFAVVCLPVQANTLRLDDTRATLHPLETLALNATLTPTPTRAEDAALTWTSFNPEVATVDENGVVTAHKPGYAYIKVSTDINTSVTAYCVVEVLPGQGYTVTLDANGGMVKPDSVSVQYGIAVGQLPVPVREGYTFDGWYDENGAQYTEDTIYAIAGDATLTARWTANIYEITLDANGGVTDVALVQVTFGQAVGALPTPTREGYVFLGWFDEVGSRYDASTVYSTADGVTLTARWGQEDSTFTITLNANGGKVEPSALAVVYGQAVGTLPVPTREGYTFGGWYDKDGNRYDASSVYSVKGDTTLTARWIENSVQTGDGFPIFLLSGAMMAAAAGAVMLLLKRRKLMGE